MLSFNIEKNRDSKLLSNSRFSVRGLRSEKNRRVDSKHVYIYKRVLKCSYLCSLLHNRADIWHKKGDSNCVCA